MAIQIIDRIKCVHSQNIIHRDIKPDNFLIGLEDPNIIYLIDFGLSKKYKSSTTGKHISFSEVKKFTGTVSYASANALRFKEQSRRDDLESISYMLIYLMKGSLPWQKIKVNNKKESYLKISQFKRNIKPEKLCENLPGEMIDFVNYVKKLQFEEEPDYNYLKNLFEIMLKKRGDDPDCIYFSWIDEKNIKTLKKPVDYSKRSSNSRERIINKIRNSLDYKRSLSDNKNKLKQNTDYNLKIKSYLDEKVLNNIKQYDLSKSKIYSDVSNENQHINYIYNSINNNYITISVSISNSNTNTNTINSKEENKKLFGFG
jgi:serine/threonine protein kinase